MALAGCEASHPPEENQAEPGNNVAAPSPVTVPSPEQPLDRERLLLAVAQARSAHAAGADDRAAQAELDGGRFELRLRFGCGAPAGAAAGNPSVRHDAAARTVELSASANLDLSDPLVAAAAGQGIEAVDGIWLARPWLLQAACPPAALLSPETPAAEAPAQPPREIGIAQFFTPDDSRVGRRGDRSYRHVVRFEEGQDPARPQGYDLVLSGRLRAGPAGRVIRCAAPDPSTRPACLISAEFEEVRMEDAERREVLARWRRG
jgi:hypothetical protein